MGAGLLVGVLALLWGGAVHPVPPPAATVVRHLVESFLGPGTVTAVLVHSSGRQVDVHVRMDGVRSLPADRGDWLWFFRDVSEIATARLFQPPQPHRGLQRLVRVRLWYRLRGRVVAHATRERTQEALTVVLSP